jgi:hypothetical protein
VVVLVVVGEGIPPSVDKDPKFKKEKAELAVAAAPAADASLLIPAAEIAVAAVVVLLVVVLLAPPFALDWVTVAAAAAAVPFNSKPPNIFNATHTLTASRDNQDRARASVRVSLLFVACLGQQTHASPTLFRSVSYGQFRVIQIHIHIFERSIS